MAHKTESVDVAVPVRTAYNQWTQFEQFPRFMRQVKEVRQVNDTLTHWTVEINGIRREFDAQITEQQPDRRIAWSSINGMHQRGMVTFEPIDAGHTRVTAELDLEPSGFAEHVADATGMIGHSVHEDLANFKEFIEHQGGEAGAWRGRVEDGRVTGSSADIPAGPAGPGRSTGLSDPATGMTGMSDPAGARGMTAPAGTGPRPGSMEAQGLSDPAGMASADDDRMTPLNDRVTPQTLRQRMTPTHGAGTPSEPGAMTGPDTMTASGGGAMAGMSAPDPLDDPLLADPALNDPGMGEHDERMHRDERIPDDGGQRDEHGRDRQDRDPDQPGTWRHPDA